MIENRPVEVTTDSAEQNVVSEEEALRQAYDEYLRNNVDEPTEADTLLSFEEWLQLEELPHLDYCDTVRWELAMHTDINQHSLIRQMNAEERHGSGFVVEPRWYLVKCEPIDYAVFTHEQWERKVIAAYQEIYRRYCEDELMPLTPVVKNGRIPRRGPCILRKVARQHEAVHKALREISMYAFHGCVLSECDREKRKAIERDIRELEDLLS